MNAIEKRIVSSYNRFAAAIDKQLQGYMRRSNIPAFSAMLKKLTLKTFFYNHDVIKKAVGTKIVLIDNLVYDLLVESLAKSIYSAVNSTDKVDGTKVGWWTNSSIVDMVRRNSAFCPGGEDDEMYFVSYGFEAMNADTIESIEAGKAEGITLMKFLDFDESKFNGVVLAIIRNVMATVESVRTTYWPTVYQLEEGETLDDHLINIFLRSMESVKESADDDTSVETAFMESVTLFGSTVLADGGVDLENVRTVLEKTTIRYVREKIKKTKTQIEALTMYYSFKDDNDEDIMISVTFPTDTIVTVFNSQEDKIPKTMRGDLGRRLKAYVNDFCNFMFLAS